MFIRNMTIPPIRVGSKIEAIAFLPEQLFSEQELVVQSIFGTRDDTYSDDNISIFEQLPVI